MQRERAQREASVSRSRTPKDQRMMTSSSQEKKQENTLIDLVIETGMSTRLSLDQNLILRSMKISLWLSVSERQKIVTLTDG